MFTFFLLAISFLVIFINVWYFLIFFETKEEYVQDKKVSNFPTVSVLVPAYNEERIIAKTLNHLLNLDYPKSKLEVIVVDDGSTDKTYEIASTFSKHGVKVFRKQNEGKPKALNFGLKRCHGELIMVMDADCFPERDLLKKMVPLLDKDTVAVTSSIKVHEPKNFWEKLQTIEYSFMNFYRKLSSCVYGLFTTPTASLYKRSFFNKHGNFDPTTLTEDLEMGLRIHSKGYNVAHAFDANAFTLVPRTFKRLLKQRIRWYHGALQNYTKYRHLFNFSYGDLGTFILPMSLTFLTIPALLLLISVGDTIIDNLRKLQYFSLIGYDITFLYQQIFSLMGMEWIDLFLDLKAGLTLLLVGLGFLTLLLIRRYEKVNPLHFLIYALIGPSLLALCEAIALGYFLLRKNPGW
jgi:cellulose synthase/poly-beta-1,6-N-acetylglucosamine synthase-like glycosyltransferase